MYYYLLTKYTYRPYTSCIGCAGDSKHTIVVLSIKLIQHAGNPFAVYMGCRFNDKNYCMRQT